MSHHPVRSAGLPAPVGPYSPGMQFERLVFVSGQGATDPRTGQLAGDDVAAQTAQCLANVETILLAAGSSLQCVLRCGVFLLDMAEFPQMNAVYSRVVRRPPPGAHDHPGGRAPRRGPPRRDRRDRLRALTEPGGPRRAAAGLDTLCLVAAWRWRQRRWIGLAVAFPLLGAAVASSGRSGEPALAAHAAGIACALVVSGTVAFVSYLRRAPKPRLETDGRARSPGRRRHRPSPPRGPARVVLWLSSIPWRTPIACFASGGEPSPGNLSSTSPKLEVAGTSSSPRGPGKCPTRATC